MIAIKMYSHCDKETVQQYITNVIAINKYSQGDKDRRRYSLLNEIIEYQTNEQEHQSLIVNTSLNQEQKL